MYASITDIGGGSFEGVCMSSNATADFRDPPHLSSIREVIRGTLHVSAGHSGGW
jgi:hypothetical protein